MNTLDWAQTNGRKFRWVAALDNHEPTRDFAYGDGWDYDRQDETRGAGIILADVHELKDAYKASYLVDDGRTVRPFYVSGWNGFDDDEGMFKLLYLQPFPVNFHEDGTPILRNDDNRPVDFSGWQLGPRRTYHLKVVPA